MIRKAVIIPARTESTRLPNKVLLEFDGKPLLWHTIQGALASEADKVIVAGDSVDIENAAREAGADFVLTCPANTGTQRITQALDSTQNAEFIINLQADEPMITGDAINKLFDALRQQCLVTLITPCRADEFLNADTVKVVFDSNFRALYFSRAPIPYGAGGQAFKHIGVYGFRINTLKSVAFLDHQIGFENLEQLAWMWFGYDIKVLVDESLKDTISINSPDDVAAFRLVLAHGKV